MMITKICIKMYQNGKYKLLIHNDREQRKEQDTLRINVIEMIKMILKA